MNVELKPFSEIDYARFNFSLYLPHCIRSLNHLSLLSPRIQSMKMVDGKPEYKGALDVIVKVAKNEGFFSLWKGFTPYYFR